MRCRQLTGKNEFESLKPIDDAVKRYIDSDDKLAFQINGEWGTGKTWYIKNFMEKSKNRYDFSYVSLSGETDLKNTYKEILFQLYNKFNQIITKYKDPIKELTPSKIKGVSTKNLPGLMIDFWDRHIEKTIISDARNKTIIVDDLERVDESITSNELIAFIQKLLEDGFKIIIISNEEKLDNKENTQKFKFIKEKIINKTISFGNFNKGIALQIINSGLNKILNNTNQELSKWISNISNKLIVKNNINLRSIETIISTFNEVVYEINEENETQDLKDQAIKTAYISIFLFTFGTKNNYFSFDLAHLKNLKYENFSTNLYDLISKINMNKHSYQVELEDNPDRSNKLERTLKDLDNYLKPLEFLESYVENANREFKNNFMLTEEILNEVIKGIFNVNEYLKNINAMFFGPDMEIINNFIIGPYISDYDLKKLENKIINIVQIDITLSSSILLKIFWRFKFIRKAKLPSINLNKVNALKSKLFNKMKKNNLYELDNLSMENDRLADGNYKDNNYVEIKMEIKSLIKNLSKKQDKNLFIAILNGTSINSRHNISVDYIIDFLMGNTKIIEDELMTKTNKCIRLTNYVNEQIDNSNPKKSITCNKNKLLIKMKNKNNEQTDTVQQYYFSNLIIALETYLKHQ